jgi:signal transduction histidine kinase
MSLGRLTRFHGPADAVLAGVLLLVGESQVWLAWDDGGVGGTPHGHRLARALLAAAFTLPLAWRRRAPIVVIATICAALAGQLEFVVPVLPFLAGLVPLMIANYSVAAYGPARLRVLGLVAVFATEAVLYLRVPAERVGGEVLFGIFVGLGTWVVGDVVRGRVDRAARAVEEADERLSERDAQARTALVEERTRIARELHDVIAHGVSVMGVQAGAARLLLDSDPDAARAALLRIEATARSSAGELQRLVTVFRADGEHPDRLPGAGLAHLGTLVSDVRAAGLPVELAVSGTPVPLSPGLDVAAYRIVQEALTNALKHAGTATSVGIHHGQKEVRIVVTNSIPEPPRRGNGGVGHGLMGMRERAALYGGTLDAGPDGAGSFVVRAGLPVESGALAWSAL